jgi:hypothetical protein
MSNFVEVLGEVIKKIMRALTWGNCTSFMCTCFLIELSDEWMHRTALGTADGATDIAKWKEK